MAIQRAVICLVLAVLSLRVSAEVDRPLVEADLRGSVRPHPRLMLSDETLKALIASSETDATLHRISTQVVELAQQYVDAESLRHELKGPRLLSVSRDCLIRTYALALAWRWTGEAQYAHAGVANLKTVCAFPDWNPSHFLDTAEMSHAVAIGYDWLYEFMDDATRAEVRAGLIKHGMEEGVKAYQKTKPWWIKSAFNWNQVCNSGLLIGALAILETDPAYAEVIVPAAVASLPTAIGSYDPDGVWTEGPAYWNYATSYTAYGLAALESALGSSYGLTAHAGLAKTAWFPLLATGPTGLFVNFADSKQNSQRKPMPVLFWLARTYDLPGVAYLEHELLSKNTALPMHLMWYVPAGTRESAALPLDMVFDSTVPVAVSRSRWNDENALFIGFKGGYNQVNHGHLDLGNFELDALGNRWARDLGSDDYNLPGYWDKKAGGKRWAYYRLNSLSHNVPLIDGKGQDPNGKAGKIYSETSAGGSFFVVDLSDAYTEAISLTRGVKVFAERRAVLVQDAFELKSPLPVAWGMTTDAAITVNGPHSATLVQNGKTLQVDILQPSEGAFVVESAAQPDPQHNNNGVTRLIATVPAGDTNVTLSVCLRPEWPDGVATPLPTVRPIQDWEP